MPERDVECKSRRTFLDRKTPDEPTIRFLAAQKAERSTWPATKFRENKDYEAAPEPTMTTAVAASFWHRAHLFRPIAINMVAVSLFGCGKRMQGAGIRRQLMHLHLDVESEALVGDA
jgi:hypothetical protein